MNNESNISERLDIKKRHIKERYKEIEGPEREHRRHVHVGVTGSMVLHGCHTPLRLAHPEQNTRKDPHTHYWVWLQNKNI